MLSSNVLRSLRGLLTTSGRRARKWMEGGSRRQPARQARLGVEALERREVPALLLSPIVHSNYLGGVAGGGTSFGLDPNGTVYESLDGNSWAPVTGSNTKATGLVVAEGGRVFMLASNGAANQSVWQYSGLQYDWGQPLTDANTNVTALVSTSDNGDLFMLAGNVNAPLFQTVYERTYTQLPPIGGAWNWQARTYNIWAATDLVANGANVYILENGSSPGVYQYSGSGYNWSPLTGSNTHATTLVSNWSGLYMLGSNGPNYQYQTVWKYGGSPYNWTPVTLWNTDAFQLLQGADGYLYMVATKMGGNGVPNVYRYSNSGSDWGQPLTGPYLQDALSAWQLVLGHPSASSAYSQVNGTLFNNGTPSYLDVQQGNLGDCWLMASLAEVAAVAPADISGMFIYDGTTVENGSTVGVYSVRLYDPYGNAHYFTVDTELPGGGGTYDQPVGGAGAVNLSASPVLWAALAEKAYVEANAVGLVASNFTGDNAYGAINGGHASWALPAITGLSVSSDSSDPSDVASAWNAGKFIVLGTDSPSNPGFVKDHDYAVVGYDPSRSYPFHIFNPWGTDASGWAPGNYGSIYGLCWTSNWSISNNFSTAFTDRYAPGGRKDRHARSSQELADLAFIEELLDPHAKARKRGVVSPTSAVSVN
jgi:hypothetical protein